MGRPQPAGRRLLAAHHVRDSRDDGHRRPLGDTGSGAAAVPRGDGVALIPRAALDIDETWFVAGMKFSASNCIVIGDVVFVPAHRVMPVPRDRGTARESGHAGESLYRSVFVPLLTIILTGPQLGLGRGGRCREKGRRRRGRPRRCRRAAAGRAAWLKIYAYCVGGQADDANKRSTTL